MSSSRHLSHGCSCLRSTYEVAIHGLKQRMQIGHQQQCPSFASRLGIKDQDLSTAPIQILGHQQDANEEYNSLYGLKKYFYQKRCRTLALSPCHFHCSQTVARI